MNRPWQIWLLFIACVLGVAAGMAWLTQQALRADERRRAAESEAELEQRVSLALWRMDTELAPIIAEEVIRPPAAFRPNGVPVDPPPYVLLQFEARPNGRWMSPQVAVSYGKGKKSTTESPRLKELSKVVDLNHLIAELPKTPLPTVAEGGQNLAAANPPATTNSDGDDVQFFEGNTLNAANAPPQPPASQSQQQEPQVAQQARGVNFDPNADFQQRSKRYQSAAQQSLSNIGQRGMNQAAAPSVPQVKRDENPFGKSVAPEQVGVSRPVWVGDRLLLVRRVSNGETFLQGSWLDWPKLKTRLLGEAKDMLPGADLTPVNSDGANDPSRMLAGLPVRLVVGETAQAGFVGPTLRWALTIGWSAVLLAVAAAALLLQGVITLSERRAAFVSSVTHELRTPLTTFRMYAEMLARGMVPDANRRQEYFTTLQREAERLTLLVENVLAYARLERGRKPQAQDRVTLRSLLERVGPRLKLRAAQAGMDCDVRVDKAAADQAFTTDQAVVEQILFNLVDNAAKYARDADDRRIHVDATGNGTKVSVVVRDHGPGIDARPWSRRMQPFGKSAQESAESAPGVGLGLALCRRLARQLGGRLEIDGARQGGASVSLILPTSQ